MIVFMFTLIFAGGGTASSTTPGANDSVNAIVTDSLNVHDFHADRQPKCNLTVDDFQIIKQVSNLLKKEKVVIIEYHLDFINYTKSPLKIKDSFKPEIWFRAANEHGHILLNLAFNYGILSMKTLTLGTAKLNVSIIDRPPNCMQQSTDNEQLYSIQYLLLRDFIFESKVTLAWKESVCRRIVVNQHGKASFVHECVSVDSETSRLVVSYHIENTWIHILRILLVVVKIIAFAYVPCILVSVIKGLIKQRIPYVVRLPENCSLQKTIMMIDDPILKNKYLLDNKLIDLSKEHGFKKLKNILLNCSYSLNKPCSVTFQQYDILVDYHRTQTEDCVKVGFMQTLVGLAFRCKFKEIGPFVMCCQAKLFKYIAEDKCYLLWITFWRKIAAILLVIVIPLPYYLRLVIYYLYEHDEIVNRKKISARLGLANNFESSFIHYLTPLHPLYVTIYVLYFVTALIVALAPNKHEDRYPNHVLKRIVNSFRDLDEFSFSKVVSYVFANFTYPFYKHGIFGCFVCIFYWAMALPLVIFVCLVYSIPTFYVMVRMVHYCSEAIFMRLRKKCKPQLIYQVHKRTSQKKLLEKLKIENIQLHLPGSTPISDDSHADARIWKEQDLNSRKKADCWHCFTYALTTLLCILTFCGVVFILAELTEFVIQIIVFTIMGIIVNASYILRHVLVVAIIVIYCLDSFFNMEKKYLKMNKMLFLEVTKRIQSIESVTCLPSYLQENRGFKSQELNEQAFYENIDEIVPIKHWFINDLVLLMDSDDTPRIPRKLFKEVCNIRVPGVPGPIYRGQLDALKQLAKVLFFIFLVIIAVMIFAEVYSLSSTNQLIATVAGSFLPLIFRSWMFQQSSDIEVNTVTFKCHLDELIKSFHQNWPIYDLAFMFDNANIPDNAEPEIVVYVPRTIRCSESLNEVTSN